MSSAPKRKRWIAGIGVRLTLWGAALTTLLVALVSATLYAGMYYSMRAQIDAFLEGEIHEFMLTVNEHPNDDRSSESSIRAELGARKRADLAFRLLDLEGRPLLSSVEPDPLSGLWHASAGWTRDDPTVRCETIQRLGESYPYRVCSLRVITGDGRSCTAQSSFLMDQMIESLATFRRLCAAVFVVAPIAALAIGGFLARRSLQPVRRIMEQARSMEARDLHSRIPQSGTGDEIDQLAETLNGLLERIGHKVQEVQRFTADASHELRTPLTALRGNAEVLLSRPRSPDELRQAIEESIVQFERLQRITEDLLLLARLDAGESVIRPKQLSLERAVADVVELYTPLAEDRRLSLELISPEQVRVFGDDDRLRQVVGNLIDNAIKHTPACGSVRVSVDRLDGHARLRVADTGSGISAEDLPRVFDRFYRTDPSRSAQSPRGAGLGLSICRSIVEAHGGRIEIQSTPDQGTVATLLLPDA